MKQQLKKLIHSLYTEVNDRYIEIDDQRARIRSLEKSLLNMHEETHGLVIQNRRLEDYVETLQEFIAAQSCDNSCSSGWRKGFSGPCDCFKSKVPGMPMDYVLNDWMEAIEAPDLGGFTVPTMPEEGEEEEEEVGGLASVCVTVTSNTTTGPYGEQEGEHLLNFDVDMPESSGVSEEQIAECIHKILKEFGPKQLEGSFVFQCYKETKS